MKAAGVAKRGAGAFALGRRKRPIFHGWENEGAAPPVMAFPPKRQILQKGSNQKGGGICVGDGRKSR